MSIENPISSDILVVIQPAIVRVKGSLIHVAPPKGVEGREVKVNPLNLQAAILMGRKITVSTAALHTLLQHQIPVVLVSRQTIGILSSPHTIAIPEARWAQYSYLQDESLKLSLAKQLAKSRILGYGNVLARYAQLRDKPELAEEAKTKARTGEKMIEDALTVKDVILAEAHAAQQLWAIAKQLIPQEYEKHGFTGRNPRSKDPINQSLNYLHAILYSLSYKAIIAAGLDPHLGALHREGYGKTPLVYDFSEQLKPIALRALLVAANNTQLKINRNTRMLTRKSIETLTINLQKYLSAGRNPPRYEAYRHAILLRETFKQKAIYKPYIYNPLR